MTQQTQALHHIYLFSHPLEISRYFTLVNSSWYFEATEERLWQSLIERDFLLNVEIVDDDQNLRKLYFSLISTKWRWRRGVLPPGLPSSNDHYDHLFKILICGEKKVGKSSLLMSLVKQRNNPENIMKNISKFDMSYLTTKTVNVLRKTETIKLQFYDSNIVDMTN